MTSISCRYCKEIGEIPFACVPLSTAVVVTHKEVSTRAYTIQPCPTQGAVTLYDGGCPVALVWSDCHFLMMSRRGWADLEQRLGEAQSLAVQQGRVFGPCIEKTSKMR